MQQPTKQDAKEGFDYGVFFAESGLSPEEMTQEDWDYIGQPPPPVDKPPVTVKSVRNKFVADYAMNWLMDSAKEIYTGVTTGGISRGIGDAMETTSEAGDAFVEGGGVTGFSKVIAKEVGRGSVDFASKQVQAAAIVWDAIAEASGDEELPVDKRLGGLYNVGKAWAESYNRMYPIDSEHPLSDTLVLEAFRSMPNTFGALGAGFLLQGATGGALPPQVGAFLSSYAAEGASAYEEVLAATGSEDDAWAAFVMVGGGAAGLEVIPINKWLNKLPVNLKNILLTSAEEFGTEALTEVGTNAFAKYWSEHDKERGLFDGAVRSGQVGAIGALLSGGLLKAGSMAKAGAGKISAQLDAATPGTEAMDPRGPQSEAPVIGEPTDVQVGEGEIADATPAPEIVENEDGTFSAEVPTVSEEGYEGTRTVTADTEVEVEAEVARPKVTETPEFTEKFEGSKVTDEGGEPIVVYHGTDQAVSAFDISKFGRTDSGTYGPGFYFEVDAGIAASYATVNREMLESGEGVQIDDVRHGGNVIPVYLDIKNPYYPGEGPHASLASEFSAEGLNAKLKELGYDGIIERRGGKYFVFSPDQIISALTGKVMSEQTPAQPAPTEERAAEAVPEESAEEWLARQPEPADWYEKNAIKIAAEGGVKERALYESIRKDKEDTVQAELKFDEKEIGTFKEVWDEYIAKFNPSDDPKNARYDEWPTRPGELAEGMNAGMFSSELPGNLAWLIRRYYEKTGKPIPQGVADSLAEFDEALANEFHPDLQVGATGFENEAVQGLLGSVNAQIDMPGMEDPDLESYVRDLTRYHYLTESMAEAFTDELRGEAALGKPAQTPTQPAPTAAEPAQPQPAPLLPQNEPGAPDPGDKTYSVKNRKMAEALEEMQQEPVPEADVVTFKEANDQAARTLQEDPQAGVDLVERLRDPKQNASYKDTALLHHEAVRLGVERELVEEQIIAAKSSGNEEALDAATTKRDRIEAEYKETADTFKRVGTDQARALSFRRMELKRDYSLAALERRLAATKAEPLTEEDRALASETAKQIKELTERIEVAEAEAAKVQDAYANLEKKVLAKRAKAKSPRKSAPNRTAVYLRKQADLARARIKERASHMRAGFDSQDIADHAIIGASHIADGIVEAKAWAAKMTEEFGEAIKPYLDKIREAAEQRHASAEPEAVRANALEKLKTSKNPKVGIEELARSYVEEGMRDRDEVVDAIHADVGDQFTRDEVSDLLAGYGLFKPLSTAEVATELRRIKGELQQVGKLRDLREGKAPKKSGIEGRKAEEEERRLAKEVRRLQKELGIETTDPETQTKSALDSLKTRLTNQIEDIELEIARRERTKKSTKPTPTDAEVEALRADLARVRAIRDEVFRQETENEQVATAERLLQARNEELRAKIERGDTSVPERKSGPISQTMQVLRDERKALNKDLAELRKPKLTPEEIEAKREAAALKALHARLERQIADLTRRVKDKDFSKRQPRKLDLDSEAVRLQTELEAAKQAYEMVLHEHRVANQSFEQRAYSVVRDILVDTPKALKSSMDLSAVARQGIIGLAAHPWLTVTEHVPMMLKAFANKEYSDWVDYALRHRPNAKMGDQAGLQLTRHNDAIGATEEAIHSRIAENFPLIGVGVRASNRAFTTFLNVQRAAMFDMAVDNHPTKPTAQEGKHLASAINIATGRGTLGQGHISAIVRNSSWVIWSPRLLTSRAQMVYGPLLYAGSLGKYQIVKGSGYTNKYVAQMYGRAFASAAVAYTLYTLLTGEAPEDDPRSSDFGKFRVGNTRIDPLGGLGQFLVLAGRVRAGETKRVDTGEVREAERLDTALRFLSYKVTPTWGTVRALSEGHWIDREPVTLGSTFENMYMPLALSDLGDSMEAQGVPTGLALTVLATFGWGIQSYEERPDRKSKSSSSKWIPKPKY